MAISSEVVAFESIESDEPVLISVVAPTLNEINNIGNYIQSVSDNLKEIGRFEIVIVDDNSKDGTSEFLSERREVDPNLKVLFNNKREGLSSSQLEGISLCNGNYVVVMDSDLQHPAEKIKDIVKNDFEVWINISSFGQEFTSAILAVVVDDYYLESADFLQIVTNRLDIVSYVIDLVERWSYNTYEDWLTIPD